MKGNKVTVRLCGGLGNQLFQVSSAYAFSLRYNKELVLDLSHYNKNADHGGFRLDKLKFPEFKVVNDDGLLFKIMVKVVNKFPFLSCYTKSLLHEYCFDESKLAKCSYLLGYWQCDEYFKCFFNDIKGFVIPREVSNYSSMLLQEVTQTNSISVHIRRGDYLNKEALSNHGLCSLDYYKKAISHMVERVGAPCFYIFTNDKDWVYEYKNKIFGGAEVKFVNGMSQEEDLWLMSNCKHHVIANSSFSWWGAYLARKNEQIVISPSPWYEKEQRSSNDPSLDNWVRICK